MSEKEFKIFAHGYLVDNNIINQIECSLWQMFFKNKYSHQEFTGGEINTNEFKVTIKVESKAP